LANISMRCHPATPAVAAESIDVDYEIRPDGKLWLRYFVECDLNKLILPGADDALRADGLWNSTCFELFLRNPGESRYLEFNFSPSSQWAAYQFNDYRDGMSELAMETPEIFDDASETHFALEATLALPSLLGAHIQAALSAVVHESGDVKSYWALKHPPGDPDFHHKDCFALKLAPPERA
jgi:hypothetical protein